MYNMFTTISKAGLGMYVFVAISIIKELFGIELDYNLTLDGVFTLFQAVGFILWLVGQSTRKDLKYGIFRKNGKEE